MAKSYSYTVKKFPTKVCISLKKPKSRALVRKSKYVRKRTGRRRGRRIRRAKTKTRSRKMKWAGKRGFFALCMKKHKGYKGKRKAKMCGRRYRQGLRP